jgi:hypothetical protein
MATHDDVGLSQPAASTITKRLDAISLDHNSTVVVREVMVLGSPETTNALTGVLNAAPASTAWGAVVRIAGGPSSVADLAVRSVAPSTYADAGMRRAVQSTGSDLQVLLTGLQGSSASSNSSVYLPVRLTNGTAFLTPAVDFVHDSTMNVSTVGGPATMIRSGAAVGGTTDTWKIQWGSSNGAAYVSLVTDTGVNISGSTSSPAHGTPALNVREVGSSYQSTTLTVLSSNNTAVYAALSCVAGLTHKVYGYFIGASTSGNVSTLVFLSSGSGGDAGAAKNRFAVLLSSAYGAANLAISPSAGSFLFKSDAGESLNVRLESASTAITARIGLSFFTE